ncbi:Liprin-alpha-2 [Cichlidogyrus casuarinus]|uniref:Liprin-alpha-2 n=1 Tax=Cichlidogyrus casuarinus TaxID=1844966 RepID=A0ABD2PYP5_9PLAT
MDQKSEEQSWAQPLLIQDMDDLSDAALGASNLASTSSSFSRSLIKNYFYLAWNSSLGYQTQFNDSSNLKQKRLFLDSLLASSEQFPQWSTQRIVQWLEVWLEMPAWYVAACRANIRSGAMLANLGEQELQRELGISNAMHKLKLRLGIQEMMSLSTGQMSTLDRQIFADAVRIQGELSHEWIGNQWLPSLGLAQYRPEFMECLIDGRMLTSLTKRDLRTVLRMIDHFHRKSLVYGITCLKQLNFDRFELERRREVSQTSNSGSFAFKLSLSFLDVVVWSVDRLINWLNSIGLQEWSKNLLDSGVHGAVLALDADFDVTAFCLVLRISRQDSQTRSILERELVSLLRPYRDLLTSSRDDVIANATTKS